MEIARRKSPRAPSITLDEALNRALVAYDKDRTHAAPSEVVAQNLGYKSANSGSALAAMASLRYYGLLERPKEGMLAVSKAVEQYKFSPDESHRKTLLRKFLLAPSLFAELLSMYQEGLPSDGTIRYELINRGFLPGPAETCTAVFRKSVEFVDYFSRSPEEESNVDEVADVEEERLLQEEWGASPPKESAQPTPAPPSRSVVVQQSALTMPHSMVEGGDSIPIRLTGGRRAWLVVPDRLYEADKIRLKAQIDLLLTVEEEQDLE